MRVYIASSPSPLVYSPKAATGGVVAALSEQKALKLKASLRMAPKTAADEKESDAFTEEGGE
jgi:hypothetical protein